MAYFARGRLLWTPSNRFPHEAAIREYRRALAVNPNLAEARAQLALTYSHIGLLDKALEEAQASADVNPVDALPRVVMGQALLYGGQYDRALNVWSGNPPDAYASVTASHTAWTLFQMGRKDEAATKLAAFLAQYPRDVGRSRRSSGFTRSFRQNSEAEAVIRSIAGQKGFGQFPSHGLLYRVRLCANGQTWMRRSMVERGRRERIPLLSAILARSESGALTPRSALVVVDGGSQAELGTLSETRLGEKVSGSIGRREAGFD